jgi:hypothetical protein
MLDCAEGMDDVSFDLPAVTPRRDVLGNPEIIALKSTFCFL